MLKTESELPRLLRQPLVKPRITLNTLLQITSYSLGEFLCHRKGTQAYVILLKILSTSLLEYTRQKHRTTFYKEGLK